MLAAFLAAALSSAPIGDPESVAERLRAAAGGEVRPEGLRPLAAGALLADPGRLLPGLSETVVRWVLLDAAPGARTAEDRAVVALGLWLAEHGETVVRIEPVRRRSALGDVLEWPGSLLLLEGGRVSAAVETPPAAGAPPPDGRGPARRVVSILSTNDIHGALHPYESSHPADDGETRPTIGAIASVATYVRRARAVSTATGWPLFLFDAGDIYQGTPEGTLSRGAAMVPVLEALGYDAWVPGNHDLDHGRENAEALAAALDAPAVAANAIDTPTGRTWAAVRPTHEIERGGVRIALTGVMPSSMRTLTFARNLRDLEFRPETEALAAVVPGLRAGDPDLVVVLSHAGIGVDTAFADESDLQGGIDVVVGGHTHTYLREAWVGRGGTIVVQAGARAGAVGRLDLDLAPEGGVETFAWRLVGMRADRYPPDPAMTETVRAATAGVSAEMDRVLGRAETAIPHAYRDEAPMGRLAADLLRAWAEADVAVLSGGGIRAGFLAGPVRVRDCFQVFPFGNALAVGDVRGDSLLAVLEHGVSTDRGRVQVSGATLVVDTSLPAGRRIVEARVGGAPLDPARTYRVATDAFLAQGGSGYFAGPGWTWEIRDETGMFEILRDHVEAVGTVRPPEEPRIRPRGAAAAALP